MTKKVTAILLAILFISFYSCQKEKAFLEKDKKINSLSYDDFDHIGLKHNELLTTIYNELCLKDQEGFNFKDRSDEEKFNHLKYSNAMEYFINENISDTNAYISYHEFCDDYMFDFIHGDLTILIQDSVCIFIDNPSNGFSNIQKYYLKKIMYEANSSSTLYIMRNRLNNLKEEIKRNISSERDAIVLYSVLAIGIHSSLYWEENTINWVKLFHTDGNINLEPEMLPPWAVADIAGGLIGTGLGYFRNGHTGWDLAEDALWGAGAASAFSGASSAIRYLSSK